MAWEACCRPRPSFGTPAYAAPLLIWVAVGPVRRMRGEKSLSCCGGGGWPGVLCVAFVRFGGYLDFFIYIFWRVCVCVKCKIRLFSLSFFLFSPSSEGWVYGECFMFVWFGYNSCTHA